MSVTEIIDAMKNLSPTDRATVTTALSSPSDLNQNDSEEERQAALYRLLMAEGFLKSIPPRRKKTREFKPVPIKGKPISETIIEERR